MLALASLWVPWDFPPWPIPPPASLRRRERWTGHQCHVHLPWGQSNRALGGWGRECWQRVLATFPPRGDWGSGLTPRPFHRKETGTQAHPSFSTASLCSLFPASSACVRKGLFCYHDMTSSAPGIERGLGPKERQHLCRMRHMRALVSVILLGGSLAKVPRWGGVWQGWVVGRPGPGVVLSAWFFG